MTDQGKVDRDSWKRILRSALTIFDEFKSRGTELPEVALGGGTVLMFRFEHRLSRDIDFFLHDVQWLSLLTPRLNDATAAMVVDYEEHANSVKLVLPEGGDIDFIAAGAVTVAEPVEKLDFAGYSFPLQTTAEILGKKLLYRAESFKPRDVFDLAVAVERDCESAAQAVAAAASKHDTLRRRLQHLSRQGEDELARDILPIGDFSNTLRSMIGTVRGFLRDMARSEPQSPGPGP